MTTLEVQPSITVPQEGRDAASGRTLRAYLLLPRPKDLVKAVVVPSGFAVGAVSSGGVGGAQTARALLVWLALELLVYQARYQWNDVRGFAADQAHPDAASRGRLPGPVDKGRSHVAASLATAGLRLVLTAALAVAIPSVSGVIAAMTIGVFGVATVYEGLRSAATGGAGQLPLPLRPTLVGLWVAVGAGYAVRGLTGLALAVDLAGRPGLVVAATISMWALGVVFVTCRWVLEAMAFGTCRDGKVAWSVPASQAREHTLGLVRWLPSEAPGDLTGSPRRWRALQERTPMTAPWNLALVVAGGAAALMGHLLSGPPRNAAAVATVLLGAAAAALTAWAPGRRGVVALGAATLILLTELTAGGGFAPAAVLPLLVVLGAHAQFTSRSAEEIDRPLHRLQQLLQR